MAEIDFLYFAMLTDPTDDSGTDSPVNLTINEGGVDLLNHRFGDTVRQDQEGRQANIYRLDVRPQGIESTRLGDGSIRVGLLGDDEWRPDTLSSGALLAAAEGTPPGGAAPRPVRADDRARGLARPSRQDQIPFGRHVRLAGRPGQPT